MKAMKIMIALCLLQLFVFGNHALAQGGDLLDVKSNKDAVRAELAKDGWYVVYGKTFEELDWVAVAACTYYGCLGQYFDYLLDANIEKFQKQAPDLTITVIRDLVLRAIQTRGRVFTQGRLEVSGGFATYSRWKVVRMKVPGVCDWRPCMKDIEERTNLLPHYQPYVRFRITGVTPPPPSPPPGEYDSIYYTNKCSRRIQTAVHYKNLSNEWVTEGWGILEPGQTNWIAKTTNSIFYIYAESIDPESARLYWSGLDYHSTIHGSSKTYGFKKKQITTTTWGKWTESFSCN